MSAPRMTEATVSIIQAEIKSKIATALAAVRTDRADAKVPTPNPQSYFVYPEAHGYRTPAIFILSDQFDHNQPETKANHINAIVKVAVVALLDHRNKEELTYMAWRYQSALHDILQNASLTSTDSKVKLTVVVRRNEFSPLYTNAKKEDSPEAVFRKEVRLECEVYHRENF